MKRTGTMAVCAYSPSTCCDLLPSRTSQPRDYIAIDLDQFLAKHLLRYQAEVSLRACRTSSFTSLTNSRSFDRWPPVQALRPIRCLPSGDLGPVDFVHVLHSLICSACCALLSGVQPFAMICFQ